MSDQPSSSANADQITYWNSRAGERWAAMQADIDAVFAPLTKATLDWTDAKPGDRVLDVGCGCGTSTLELARRVGASGRVLGVDVSEPMLGLATERARAVSQIELRLADASTHPFEPGTRDVVFSRFGVMFFDDPTAAFRNIRTVLTSEGRLAFVCWQPIAENSWFSVPVEAVRPNVPDQPPSDPYAPGPFAFAEPDRVRAILAAAGFSRIVITPHRTTMRLGGPGDLDGAADFSTKIGPAARMLAEVEPEVRAAAMGDVRAALAPFDGPDGVVLGGAVWLVSARA